MGETTMTYLLIYFAILAVVLPYSLMLVSVNRTDDGEVNNNDTTMSTHKVNLLNGRLPRKRKSERITRRFGPDGHLIPSEPL